MEWRRVVSKGGEWWLASNGFDGSDGDDGADRFVDLDDLDDFDGSTRRH